MKNRYSRKKLLEMDPIEVYKLLLDKEIKGFPCGFFANDSEKNNAISCIKFLIEDHLKIKKEDIPKNINTAFFKKYRLSGMLSVCFNDSPFEAINATYKDEFYPWEFGNVPRDFWNPITEQEAVQWLRNKTNFSDMTRETFKNHGLLSLLMYKFNGSVTKATEYIHMENVA